MTSKTKYNTLRYYIYRNCTPSALGQSLRSSDIFAGGERVVDERLAFIHVVNNSVRVHVIRLFGSHILEPIFVWIY